MKTLIKNVYLLTMDSNFSVFEKGYILFENDKIIALGDMVAAPQNIDADIIDGRNAILLPGMINAHTHTGMMPFRSLKEDVHDRLRRFFFPLEQHITQEIVYYSAKYAVAEMLLGGVTGLADMYYFEDEVARACDEMGIRAVLGETVIDFPVCDSPEPFGGLGYSEGFIKKWKGHDLIIPAVAPHAPYTNTTESLQKAVSIAEEYDVPVVAHVSEMAFETDKYAKEYNLSPVEYLNKIGFLSERLLAAHCIFLSDHDIELLRDNNVRVAHCIGANTKSAKGVARVYDMLNSGIKVGLGTDGPSSGNTLDIFTQQKLFACFHKTALKDNMRFTSDEIVKLATFGGAQALGIDNISGTLEVGKKADFILVETESVNMYPLNNPYSVLVYSANASNVRDVYINGKAVVRDKKLCNHDLGKIRTELDNSLSEFKKEAERLSQQVN